MISDLGVFIACTSSKLESWKRAEDLIAETSPLFFFNLILGSFSLMHNNVFISMNCRMREAHSVVTYVWFYSKMFSQASQAASFTNVGQTRFDIIG